MRWMLRLLFLIVFVVSVSGAATLVPHSGCCDATERDCFEGCQTPCGLCACCLDRTPVVAPSAVQTPLVTAIVLATTAPLASCPQPEPAEILHVPRAS